jgi:hypothetical protein
MNDNNRNPVATVMANVVIICLGLAVSAVALGLAAALLLWIF